MGDTVELEGLDTVQGALRSVAAATQDLEPANDQAGQLLLDRAGPQTPRRSGRLVASGRTDTGPDGTALVYDEAYAGVIHNGWPAHNITPQPWVADTVAESTDLVVGVYVDYLNDAITT